MRFPDWVWVDVFLLHEKPRFVLFVSCVVTLERSQIVKPHRSSWQLCIVATLCVARRQLPCKDIPRLFGEHAFAPQLGQVLEQDAAD
ncbi:MAG: hypothetical protein KDA60_13335, partial [Planctomycetales bacterium]|nr:hypothetical protein [Planctomycetales bacterium]